MRCEYILDTADKVAPVTLNAQSYNEISPPTALNEKPPIMKGNLRIFFFFVIGGVECSFTFSIILYFIMT